MQPVNRTRHILDSQSRGPRESSVYPLANTSRRSGSKPGGMEYDTQGTAVEHSCLGRTRSGISWTLKYQTASGAHADRVSRPPWRTVRIDLLCKQMRLTQVHDGSGAAHRRVNFWLSSPWLWLAPLTSALSFGSGACRLADAAQASTSSAPAEAE